MKCLMPAIGSCNWSLEVLLRQGQEVFKCRRTGNRSIFIIFESCRSARMTSLEQNLEDFIAQSSTTESVAAQDSVPQSLEEEWCTKFEPALRSALHRNTMGFVQVMTLYTLVYNRCTSTPSEGHALHDHLVRFFALYTCEIHDNAPHEALVDYYTTQWALFTDGVRFIESLFRYLDRRITAGQEGEIDTSTAVAFKSWRVNVLEPLAGRLRDELPDEALVTETLEAFIPDNFNGNGVERMRLTRAEVN
ncbi:hypothetical protein MVEN_02550400 [Mycena venus]|uniref:Cullin N-terminal domain-containing protein n=1 Tax=Mycena venus TaxID=2733690 RepID=A0A8H6WRL0_9AGAR|nr:hypothetical protein MVEN_02550400 [Mycena venus]